MFPQSTSSTVALAILQQSDTLSRLERPIDVLAAANGVKPTSEPSRPSDPVAPIDDMFSAMSVDVNKMKVNLMERLGEKLGISYDDFEDASDFGRAIKRAVNQIKMSKDGDIAIMRIEHEFGLDKLGVSLDEFVDAIIDPKSRAAEKLDAALLHEAGGVQDGDGAYELAPGQPRLDEIGLYSF